MPIRLVLTCALIATTAACSTAAQALPPPTDNGAGLLMHVSFDGTRRADVAVGDPLPSKGRYSYENFTAEGGEFIPGVFGQALTGKDRLGMYDARGNFNPHRGTVAFFLKQKNKPYGFEPLVVSTVDYYYWLRYLRLELKPGGRLVTSIANEIYRPRTVGPTDDDAPMVTEDTWHHIAIAWDENQGYVTYVDGEIHSSNWGAYHWLCHGVDNDSFWLRPDSDVAYDELYVFDRALPQSQIQALMRDNQTPSTLEPLAFGEAARKNRLAELSWSQDDAAMPRIAAGQAAHVEQVVPLVARAVMGECNIAFDGKLGNGFPALYGYRYAGGNGLHVDLPSPVDYVMIEGNFSGRVYRGRPLLQEGQTPIADIHSAQFLHRWRFESPYPAGWMSFFRYTPEDLESAPDKEQLLTGRINELGFFRLHAKPMEDGKVLNHYNIGPAIVDPSLTRFASGDRNSLVMSEGTPSEAGGQQVSGLRYQHLILPAVDVQRVLSALRLKLWVRGTDADNALRVELYDPQLPARRLAAMDWKVELVGGEPSLLDITLDHADRIVRAGDAVHVVLIFKRDVELLCGGKGRQSTVEWIAGDRERAIDQHMAADLPMMLSRFAELASPRPWTPYADPEVQLPRHYRLAAELFYPLTLMRELRPEHATVRALWAWTHKDIVDTSPIEPAPVAGHADAPRWALLQRELVDCCGDVFRWWIDNRQAPTGEFGDDLNDDTDFMQDMARYSMFRDPGRRLSQAAVDVADACVNLNALTAGISTLPTDPLHAYENGTNILPVAAMVNYGDPAHLARVMESARTIEDRLTTLDVYGRRRFRSSYYGYNEVREEGNYGVDSFNNGLFCHPALYLAYYSHNPRAMKFVTDYADGWLAYWDGADPTKLPAATRLDGTIARYDHRARGFGFSSLFVGAWHLTGDERFRDAALHWINPAAAQFRGGDAIATLDTVDVRKYAKQLAAWADRADLAHVTVDQFGYIARQRYAKYEAIGDEQAAYDALEASVRNIRLLFDAYSLGEPQNDRIWPPDMVASVMALGDSPDMRNQLFPRYYVSYEGLSDITGWVRRKTDTTLTVWLYSFAATAESGAMRVWRTPAGRYAVKVDGAASEAELHRGAPIPIRIEPGKVVEVTVDMIAPMEADYWQRPDAAVSPREISWGAGGTLRAVIHNLGNTPLHDLHVAVVDADGKTLAEQVVASIEAPVDLVSRTVTVTFDGLPDGASRIVLDPNAMIDELYEMNNTAPAPHQ